MITAIGFSGGIKLGQLFIQGATFSCDAHVFGLVNDGKTIIDATAAHGVKERPFSDLDYHWLHLVQLSEIATHSQRIRLDYLARCELGKGYDYGFVFGYPFFGRNWQDKDKWACSELWGHLLIQTGIIPQLEHLHRLTPRNLCRRLDEVSPPMPASSP